MSWQPIDTAPKDVVILAIDEWGEICLCRHSHGKHWQTADVDGGRDDFSEPALWHALPEPPK